MTKSSEGFRRSRDALLDIGDWRVWSMIVTLFGDMAQRPGEQISGPLMSGVFEHLGIKPEAMRVALHRLRKDGWIISELKGRVGMYGLSELGRAQTVAASSRIYAQEAVSPETWHVVIPMPMAERPASLKSQLENDYTSISGGIFLAAGPPKESIKECFVLTGDNSEIPHWVREKIAPEFMNHAFAQLLASLGIVEQNLDDSSQFGVLEIVALRVLIVQNWRYLALRSPELSAHFSPSDWHEPTCRRAVLDVLHRLGQPSLEQLNKALVKG